MHRQLSAFIRKFKKIQIQIQKFESIGSHQDLIGINKTRLVQIP
jgi:cell fate (sporulation/competence/biofilm development) regulator YlbF (YheA/YmcA/DUF963 family)